MGTQVSGLSTGPGRADRSSAGKYRAIQSEGAGDVALQPESEQQPTARRLEAVRTGLVGVLPTSRTAAAHLPAGGMDTAAHPEMLLASVAQCRGSGERVTTAGSASQTTPDSADGQRGVVHGADLDHERGPESPYAPPFRLPHAVRSCSEISCRVQPPDAENRTSGGVGG